MIAIRKGREVTYFEDDGETEIAKVVLPEGGYTQAELEKFIEHLVREAKRAAMGPS